MGKPSYEALPWGAELFPSLRCEQEGILLVALKHIVQFFCRTRIDDDGIFLIVEPQTAGIEVSTAHRAELSVDHDDFRVMESRFIHPNVHPFFH